MNRHVIVPPPHYDGKENNKKLSPFPLLRAAGVAINKLFSSNKKTLPRREEFLKKRIETD